MVIILLITAQLQDTTHRQLKGIDLVVRAKGSPLQLILSSVFHLDIPTGNISLKDANALSHHPLVKSAIPELLGDNYHGFRIVGTTRDYPEHYGARPVQGSYWIAPMEAVVGWETARRTGLKPGDSFAGSHRGLQRAARCMVTCLTA